MMIEVDRQKRGSVQEQLAGQIRYLIASGHFDLGDTIPSTRGLADQVDVSFHTVRKAYQQLHDEGLLDVQPGKGYVVQKRSVLGKEARMEQGADIMRGAVYQLVALGLPPFEIGALLEEQLGALETESHAQKLLFTAPYREQALDCAEQVATALQSSVDPVLSAELARHADADFVFARHADLHHVARALPGTEAVGVVAYPEPHVLQRLARLSPDDTVGLIARHTDALQPLAAEVRAHTGFQGEMRTLCADDVQGARAFAEAVDFVAFTSRSRRQVESILGDAVPHAELRTVVSADSLDAVRDAVANSRRAT